MDFYPNISILLLHLSDCDKKGYKFTDNSIQGQTLMIKLYDCGLEALKKLIICVEHFFIFEIKVKLVNSENFA